MNTLFAKILSELDKQHDMMLVTIIAEQGSTPGKVGSQMLLGSEGHLLGTIGGGVAEKKCEEKAVHLLRERRSATLELVLQQNAANGVDAVCGGNIKVFFQFISGTSEDWKRLAECIISSIYEKKERWLVLRIDGNLPSIIDSDYNTVFGRAVYCSDLVSEVPVLMNGYFSKKLPIGTRAVIFGGGHCAAALAPLLNTVGFRVTIMDNREEFANIDRFPTAEKIICGDYEHISQYITLNASDYVVIMTHGHGFDFEVQEQVLRQPLAYVGVIGSKSKKASINARLAEAGVPEEAINSVHTPIGTAIKAVTPEEIAVSIAGEMIMVRATYLEASGVVIHGGPKKQTDT